MNQTARQARAMSRRVPPDRVLYIELTEFIMNTDPGVRQSERMDDMPNHAAGDATGAPLELTAPARTPADRAFAARGGPPRGDRQVHTVPAGVGHRQPEPGDALGHLRGPG